MVQPKYEVHALGVLPESASHALRPLRVERRPVETIVHGPVNGQPALVSLLTRLEGLGLTVVGYWRLFDSDEEMAR